MNVSRNDILFSLGTGVLAGVIAWRIVTYLALPRIYDISYLWLIVLAPIAWICTIYIGEYLLPRSIRHFTRFSVIGFTNALVDYGYLNILIAFTGIATGIGFSIFKAASFIVANIASYFLNKYWTYGSSRKDNKEYISFLLVSIVAISINVITASLVVNTIAPIGSVSTATWANIAAIVGSAAALLVNFIGYTKLVFKQ